MRSAILTLSAVISAPSAVAGITLDKLIDCPEVTRLHQNLVGSIAQLGTCRPPKNGLESMLLASLGPMLEREVCFFNPQQGVMLSGFTCMRGKSTVPDLTCFRPANLVDIEDFKKKFHTTHAKTISDYQRISATCPASTGDIAPSGPTLIPWLIRPMVEYEFGFAMNLGARGSRKASGIAHHGFAVTREKFKSVGPPAIEFVNIYASLPTKDLVEKTERLTFGNWLVEIDDAVKLDEAYNTEAVKQHAPLRADYTMWDFMTRAPTDTTQRMKLVQVDKWQDVLVNALESQGFEEFQELTKSQKQELLRKVQSAQEGVWGDMSVKLHDRFMVLRSPHDPRCARRDGLMLAVVFAVQPDPLTGSSFGGIGMGIIGADDCGSDSAIRAFVSQTVEVAKQQLNEVFEDL